MEECVIRRSDAQAFLSEYAEKHRSNLYVKLIIIIFCNNLLLVPCIKTDAEELNEVKRKKTNPRDDQCEY